MNVKKSKAFAARSIGSLLIYFSFFEKMTIKIARRSFSLHAQLAHTFYLRLLCSSPALRYMAKPKSHGRTLDSYAVKHIGETIRPGDCVSMRPSESSKPLYVARVEQIEAESRGEDVRVQVRWYYRPEESIGGRRKFHGSKEVFLSDHLDIQSADTIEGKCKVHTFKSYIKLDAVGNDDFFCRFEYNSSTGAFNPDKIAVYCLCEMPYNPDDLMVQCEGCSDWFHPTCMEMTPQEAEGIDHFYCTSCSPGDSKVDSERRRR